MKIIWFKHRSWTEEGADPLKQRTRHAKVLVETRHPIFFWRKTREERMVFRPANSSFWRFADTGAVMPHPVMADLELAFDARTAFEAKASQS